VKQVSKVALRTSNLNAFLTPHILIKSSQIGSVHNFFTHSKTLFRMYRDIDFSSDSYYNDNNYSIMMTQVL